VRSTAADLDGTAIELVELPGRHHRDDAGLELELSDLSRRAPLNQNTTRAPAAQRMPGVTERRHSARYGQNDREIALNRKNSLFAGHDRGAKNWAIVASFIETCKLSGVNPHAWLTDVLTKLGNRWPAARIDELLPWASAAVTL
jgi:hypothetical protein